MDRYDETRNSASRRDLILMVAAITAGLLGFALISALGEAWVDKYIERTWLSPEEEKQCVSELQEYISENAISFADSDAINGWVSENPDVAVLIYDQGERIVRYYMGDFKKIHERLKYREEINIYSLDFVGSSHDVSIIRTDHSRLYYIISWISAAAGFALFLAIFFTVTYRRDKYIARLKEEMDLIAVGNLNCEVTVRGNDELADLAQNLNQMRKSLLQHIEEEERLAHDIRTPLTSIMLYAEILKNDKYGSEEQKKRCIDGIRGGAEKISGITAQLMKHMRNEEAIDIAVREPERKKISEYLPKAICDTADALKLCGFCINERIEPIGVSERTDMMSASDELSFARILENIRSNIIRYADDGYPIEIVCREENGNIIAEFKNVIKESGDKAAEQNPCGIGLKSVQALMQSLGGRQETEQSGRSFMIRLILPA